MRTDTESTTIRVVRGVATGLSLAYATLLLLFFMIGVPLIFLIADERPKGKEIWEVVAVVLPLVAAFAAIMVTWVRERAGGIACVITGIWLMTALAITLRENQVAVASIAGIPLLLCGIAFTWVGMTDKGGSLSNTHS